MASTFSKAVIVADFYANQDYIAKNLCENRGTRCFIAVDAVSLGNDWRGKITRIRTTRKGVRRTKRSFL